MNFKSLEAEQSTIGGILLNNNKFADALFLEPKDFTEPSHREIFKAIKELANQQIEFDIVTITEHLEKNKIEIDIRYLTELANNTPSSANVGTYAKIVKERSDHRKFHSLSSLVQTLSESDLSVQEKSNKLWGEIVKLGEEVSSGGPVRVKDLMNDFVLALETRGKQDGSLQGLETGLTVLDTRYNGLKNGDLIILAGRPSMGKSTLALNIAEHNALQEKTVVFFSLEMPKAQLVERSVSSLSRVEFSRLQSAGLNDEHWPLVTNTAQKLIKTNLFIDDQGAQTPANIAIQSKRIAAKTGGVDLIVIDYLQLMQCEGENRTNEISNISRALKALAKDMDCPVIALSQLNRGVESRPEKRPLMSDLRESGSIEQDADIITFLYRDEYYFEDIPTNKGVAECITRKFRNGRVGTDLVQSSLDVCRFDNLPAINYVSARDTKQDKKVRGFPG